MSLNFPSNDPDSLAGTVSLTQDGSIGCPDKHVMSRLVRDATCYSFRGDEAGASGWLASHPRDMISCLGEIFATVMKSRTPIWIEGNSEDFMMYSGSGFSEDFIRMIPDGEMGFLFFPEDENILGTIMFWTGESDATRGNGGLTNLSMSPVVQHIDVSRFLLLDRDMSPGFIDLLRGSDIRLGAIRKLGDLHQSLSEGISATILSGMIDDAAIINGHEKDIPWRESYVKVMGGLSARMVFFAIASLGIMLLDSNDVLRAPGKLMRNSRSLYWKPYGDTLLIPDARMSPYVTGQVTLKTCDASVFQQGD